MEEKLVKIALQVLNTNEEFDIDTPREKIEKWDSLVHLQLVMEVEDQLGIFVPIESIGDIKCLRDFLYYK